MQNKEYWEYKSTLIREPNFYNPLYENIEQDQYHNWYVELSENNRGFSPLNKILKGEKLSNIVKGITLKAKDESYYLLKMIEAGNKKDKIEHDNILRYLLDFAYEGINEYTKTI